MSLLASCKRIVCSKFVASQMLAALFVNFVCPFAFLSLIYVLPGKDIAWNSGAVISTSLISPFLSALLAPMPLSIWIEREVHAKRLSLLPYAHSNALSYCMVRHLLIGYILAIFFAPLYIFLFWSMRPSVSALRFVFLTSLTICVASTVIIPIAVLLFLTETSYKRVQWQMSSLTGNWMHVLLIKITRMPFC